MDPLASAIWLVYLVALIFSWSADHQGTTRLHEHLETA